MKTEKTSDSKKTAAVSVFLAVLFAAAVVFSFLIMKNAGNGRTAYIYSNGNLVKTIRLDRLKESETFIIETADGGYNKIEAEPGKIHVTEASCPDKVCINMGYSSSALPVSCLPNKLIIKIEGGSSEDEPDIIVQ